MAMVVDQALFHKIICCAINHRISFIFGNGLREFLRMLFYYETKVGKETKLV